MGLAVHNTFFLRNSSERRSSRPSRSHGGNWLFTDSSLHSKCCREAVARWLGELHKEKGRARARPITFQVDATLMEALLRSTRDRRHQQYFISILKRVRRPAQKADVFFIHVHVEETAHLS